MPTTDADRTQASGHDKRDAARGRARRASRAFGVALLALIGAMALAPRAHAQAIRGRVYDLETGAGVPNAEVAIWRAQVPLATVHTDSTGLFLVPVRDTGTFQLISRKVGFFGGSIGDLRVATRDTFDLLVRMERIAQVLQTLKVEGERAGLDFTSGFEERRKKGIGYYVGPEEIAKRGFARAPEIVYGVPGIQVVTDATQPGMPIQRILSTRASGLSVCEPALYVDGIQSDAEDLARNYTSNDISAVEVYHASQVPGRYSTGRSLCGVVLFWTKSRSGKDKDR
jgi:hypothetical protein